MGRLKIYRLRSFLAGLLALLLAIAPASVNPTSGGYQLFERVAPGISADIQLESLENFSPPPETASEYANATNTTFDFTTNGAGNDLRRFTTLDGTDVRINSGHAYNRTHAGGDVSQIGTMDEIESAILRDISSNSRLGSLQSRTTQAHTVQVNGQTVGYSLADAPVGANINYYPVTE